MSRRTLLLLAFTPLLLLFAGVGAYYAWGGVLKRRYHQRLDALRAEGVPTRWADLVEPVVPDADNGAGLLEESEALRETIEEAAEEGLGWMTPWRVECWEEEAEVAEEDRWLAVQVVARLAPYYAKLADVLTRPYLKLAREAPLGGVQFMPVQNAIEYVDMRARIDPTWSDEALDLMLGLLTRWRIQSGVELIVRPIQWRTPCELLRRMLQDEPVPDEPLLARWGPALARSEVGLPADLRNASRAGLVQQIWLVGEWEAGRDPFAEMRATFEELGSLLVGVELDGDARVAIDAVDALERSLLRMPWQARWWGRPFLWHHAVRVIDRHAEIHRVDRGDLEALRTRLDEMRQRADWRENLDRVNGVRFALHQAAASRLARVALAIHDHQVEHGSPPSALDALAERLGGTVPLDPLTGMPLHYQVGAERIVLQVDPVGALLPFVLSPVDEPSGEAIRDQMVEGLLHWSLPARRP